MTDEKLKKLSKAELVEYVELKEALDKKKKWNHWKKNPKNFIEECLKIYPKDTTLGLIPLKVNSAQVLIINEFNRQMKEVGYIFKHSSMKFLGFFFQ